MTHYIAGSMMKTIMTSFINHLFLFLNEVTNQLTMTKEGKDKGTEQLSRKVSKVKLQ